MENKNKEKLLAIELRKTGHSLSEISDKLKIAKSSASIWVREVKMDKKAKDRIFYLKRIAIDKAIKINHKNAIVRKRNCSDWAKKVLSEKKFDIFENQMICSLLYWGEGAKFSNRIEFTNSDPKMVKTFLISLINGFNIDKSKIRVNLHLHKYHNELKQKKMWCDLLKISEDQFNKTFWKENSNKIKRLDYQGCIRICYHSKEIVDKMKSFCKELSNKI
ncbi:MAG: helix-turn-helix domain-containing protein [Candidatus Shapirobacteria bacterium]